MADSVLKNGLIWPSFRNPGNPHGPQMNRSIATKKHVIAQLAERWPALFDQKKPIPLAVGIYTPLAEAMPDIPTCHLRDAMAFWCNRAHYLMAMTAGAERHGLDGPQGEVTEEAAKDARNRLEALQSWQKEKARAKRQAEKERQAGIRKKAEKAAAKAKPTKPTPPPAAAKPAAPVIVVKKRRTSPPGKG